MPFLLPRTQTLHPNLPRLLTKKEIETVGSLEEIQLIYYSFSYAYSCDPDTFVSRSLPSAKSHLYTHLNSKMYKTKRKYYEHNKLERLVPGSWDLRIVHDPQDMAVDPSPADRDLDSFDEDSDGDGAGGGGGVGGALELEVPVQPPVGGAGEGAGLTGVPTALAQPPVGGAGGGAGLAVGVGAEVLPPVGGAGGGAGLAVGAGAEVLPMVGVAGGGAGLAVGAGAEVLPPVGGLRPTAVDAALARFSNVPAGAGKQAGQPGRRSSQVRIARARMHVFTHTHTHTHTHTLLRHKTQTGKRKAPAAPESSNKVQCM